MRTSSITIISLTALYNPWLTLQSQSAVTQRPNVLFVISDDQSYPHTSAYGSDFVKTPGFDFVAEHGWLFSNAFVTSPGSSPSRASILTGLYPWQIEEAGTHASSFPAKYTCFPDLLEAEGYKIGYTGKGWGPGDWKVSGRRRNPAGPVYNEKKTNPPYSGISRIAYADNFKEFFAQKRDKQPFYFWVGGNEPHRPYEEGSWKSENKVLSNVIVPPYLPDQEPIRGDLMDYAVEIEWFDNQLNQILQFLKEQNELENTIIIVMADNGMPFPAAKANCYEYGIHVPLTICWMQGIQQGGFSEEMISSVDLFPTIMEATGITTSQERVGHSLLPYMRRQQMDSGRKYVFAGRERHSSARYSNWGYPMRAIRSKQFLYIRNYHPERWPAGDPYFLRKDGTPSPMHKAYYDIDSGASWTYIVDHKDTPELYPFFLKATAKRPYEELYDIVNDPGCFYNLIGNKSYDSVHQSLSKEMDEMLQSTHDSRATDSSEDVWETYPRLSGAIRQFTKPL